METRLFVVRLMLDNPVDGLMTLRLNSRLRLHCLSEFIRGTYGTGHKSDAIIE